MLKNGFLTRAKSLYKGNASLKSTIPERDYDISSGKDGDENKYKKTALFRSQTLYSKKSRFSSVKFSNEKTLDPTKATSLSVAFPIESDLKDGSGDLFEDCVGEIRRARVCSSEEISNETPSITAAAITVKRSHTFHGKLSMRRRNRNVQHPVAGSESVLSKETMVSLTLEPRRGNWKEQSYEKQVDFDSGQNISAISIDALFHLIMNPRIEDFYPNFVSDFFLTYIYWLKDDELWERLKEKFVYWSTNLISLDGFRQSFKRKNDKNPWNLEDYHALEISLR